MRLICPNCGAQYEVANDVIPAAGRDVQCSNCGHTWFEQPGASEAAEAGDAYVPPRPPAAAPAASPRSTPPSRQPEPKVQDAEPDKSLPDDDEWPASKSIETGTTDDPSSSSDGDDDLTEAPSADRWNNEDIEPQDTFDTQGKQSAHIQDNLGTDGKDAATAESHAAPTPKERRPSLATRSTVTPQIAEILREEAAREEAARRAEVESAFQSQPDLGLEAPLDHDAQLAEEARRRMLRMRGDEAPTIGTTASATRRELLPDIEEINSSLGKSPPRPATTQRNAVPEETSRGRRGFRLGFSVVLLIALGALLAYTNVPSLAQRVPSIAPLMSTYVTNVDQGRLWLDMRVQALLKQLEGAEGVTPATTSTGN
jgi:predicted Zn finger-like uncharacterized protein